MKFCIGKKEFSAHDAAEWCVLAMPDRCEREDGTKTLNGFTQTAAALHMYFMMLETQDLLRGVPASGREERRFKPLFETVSQFVARGSVLTSSGAFLRYAEGAGPFGDLLSFLDAKPLPNTRGAPHTLTGGQCYA
jgi:hypothetical protein